MNEQDIRKLLNELRTLKRTGELDNEKRLAEQTVKWRNAIEYSVLEMCVKHHCEEIRLEVLSLLVESKKSTLNFTGPELNLIISFLTYNLGEKIEFVPLIKKGLKRFKDSLIVMKRKVTQEQKARDHHMNVTNSSEINQEALDESYKISLKFEREIEIYKKFFAELCNLCVNDLYPDATYSHRQHSLQILCLMQDIVKDEFTEVSWTREQSEKILECLLLDTYEANKEMAFQVIKSFDLDLLKLNMKEQVFDMIDTALKLGNGIRPIDSITAAYILKICILSPVTHEILSTQFTCHSATKIAVESVESVTLQFVQLLLTKLEKSLVLAKENIVKTVTKYSLYGYLFCLRSLLNDCDLRTAASEKLWHEAIAKLISICFQLNHAVSVIVNNSSPEGHLPMDLSTQSINDISEYSDKELVTPQMVLLCSWRTVKEVSLLFGQLASKSPISDDDSPSDLLKETQIIEIGEHLVSLLCETKHRGAFEQTYVGFSQLCNRLWRLKRPSLNELPKLWLHQILLAITGFAPNSKLCATRRSAGVPFLVQALVSTEPQLQTDLNSAALHSVMKILLKLAELESNVDMSRTINNLLYNDTIFSNYKISVESFECRNGYCSENTNVQFTEIKTHSLNILRALFRNSQLGDLVRMYVADGLIAAFKNYDGKTWAERNAATLLFSALIVRIFGVQRTKDHINLTADNKMTGRIFFERYPSLLPFILDELQTFISIHDNLIKPNVQSILLLLSRLYISYSFDEAAVNWKINEFVTLVSQCAKSRVCKTRELAARALVPLLTESTAYDTVRYLFQTISSGLDTYVSLNLMHGYMLQILEIIKRLGLVKLKLLESDLNIFFDGTDWILQNLEVSNDRPVCFPLATVYITTLHELLKSHDKTVKISNLENILRRLKRHVTTQNTLKKGPGRELYKVSVVKFIVCIGNNSHPLKTECAQLNIPQRIHLYALNSSEPDLQIIAWSTLNEVINQLECSRERRLLNNRAIDVISDTVSVLHTYNPELQDTIFDFLYNSLAATNDTYDKREICHLVLNEIRNDSKADRYCERVSYLRVLGKSYAILCHELKDEKLSMECKEDVYTRFCDNSWIGSLNSDYRTSVFNIMYDLLYVSTDDNQHNYPLLDWWTTVLQLLVDDSIDVRREASKLISKIEPPNEIECIAGMLQIFFQKFSDIMAKDCPGTAIAALFYWSLSLLGDTDYEMDETDVFNKCKNYDCYEPVQLSKQCAGLLQSIMQRHSIDAPLPADAIRWINVRLALNLPSTTTFRELLLNYKYEVPMVERKPITHITDPTYKDQLLHFLAYENLASLAR